MSTSSLTERHLLSLRDLTPAAWHALLDAAETLSGPAGREPLLRGLRTAMLFFNPSLRTRTAFEVAAHDLGSHAVNLQVGGGLWKLEHRTGVRMDGAAAEHVTEGIGALAQMVDAIGVRAFASMESAVDDADEPILQAVVNASPVPILNLESAMDHPHQGLADAMVIRRTFGREPVRVLLTWAPHIKPLPMAVANAALTAFAHEGHEITLAHPPGFDLDEHVMGDAERRVQAAGGSLSVVHDQPKAARGAQVVYAKSWGTRHAYGDAEAEQEVLLAHRDWIVDGAVMRQTDDAAFMHCLPVRRGVVVSDEVLAGKSLVFEQAQARLHVQKATLCRALGVEQ